MKKVTEFVGGGEVEKPDTGIGSVVRGVLSRFLPANIAMIAGISIGFGVGGVFSVPTWLTIGAGLTLGFGAGLLGLRRWLDPDADIAGRRSFISGLLAFPALGVLSWLAGVPWDPVSFGLFSIAAGTAVALATYFPWLSKPDLGEEDAGFLEAEGE